MDNFNDFLVSMIFLFSHHPFLSVFTLILFLTISLSMNGYNYKLGKEDGLNNGYYLLKNWITNIIDEYYLSLIETQNKYKSKQDDDL